MDPEAGPSAISGCGLEPRERLVGIAHAPGPAAIEGVGADDDAGVECSCVLEKGRTFVANADEELAGHGGLRGRAGKGATDDRSEEHTSELQSLMRISYAVFCLKK